MASNSTISISFKVVDGADGIKTLTAATGDLQKFLSASVTEAEKLNKKFVNFAALATGLDSLSGALSSIQGVMAGLSGAYAAQIEAETQLATNMRNTMDATDAQIQSIKDLCSAQQQLGVVGDEIQLAGAQELATYLTMTDSLEALIPVMNDMVAQQYGYNASAENAVNIATMLGKVMDGQTGALSRYGYSFDEAQEKILKFGDEQDRVAVLAEVVSSSVGGSNKALAEAPYGTVKQMANALGDMKEQLGEFATKIQPFMELGAQTAMATLGVIKLSGSVQTLGGILLSVKNFAVGFWAATGVMSSQMGTAQKAVGTLRLFVAQLGTALTQGSRGLSLFATAWKGALITIPAVGLAIWGLTEAIGFLMRRYKEATATSKELEEAQTQQKQTAEALKQMEEEEASSLSRTRALMGVNIEKLKDFNGTREQEKKLVGEMNGIYGESMGYFSSVAEWYKALTSNSEAYCRQMIVEARTRRLVDQISAVEAANDKILYNEDGSRKHYSTKRKTETVRDKSYNERGGYAALGNAMANSYHTREIAGSSEFEQITAVYQKNNETLKLLNERLKDTAKEANSIAFSVKGSETPTESGGGKAKGSEGSWKVKESKVLENPKDLKTIEDFNKRISFLEAKRLKAKSEEIPFIDAEIASTKRLRDEFEGASKAAGQIKPMEGANFGDALKDGLEMGDTFAKLDAEISEMEEKMRHASSNEVMALQRVIDKLKEEREAMEALREIPGLEAGMPAIRSQLAELQSLDGKELEVKLKSIGGEKLRAELEAVDSHIDAISDQMNLVGMDSDQWSGLYEMREGLRGARDQLKNYIKTSDGLSERKAAQQEAIDALTGSFARLGSAIGGAAGEWISYAAGVAEAVSKAIPQIAMLVAQQKAQANANSESAVTGAMASVASIPVVGWIMAGAAATSVIAAMAGIPKFAKGGIAYGPTLGVFGEYAGAANNPEVVAPLDRLRTLLRPAESGVSGGTVRFRIDGRTLAGVLEKEYNIKHRS